MKTLESEIESFVESFGCKELQCFFRDVFPLFELYNIEEEDDWVKDIVGASDVQNVRLIRTVYLMSKIAENHAGRLCLMNLNFKNLWKRMQCVNAAEETVK